MRVSAPLQRRAPEQYVAGYEDSEAGNRGNDKGRQLSCWTRHRSSLTTGAFLA
eukprot:CAMPEP_0180249524 /NCGR_PEP_ID=MMETSP0987-20121128/37355_1 /TAXON_ID=697907 /ORGANISM="non described non described, Strain CCMP2293" /LENGTH=52 /DNA_ID=CAMNT_0022217815 /DNA_START=129 /DNA_END=283 /DNA_ORIENTATION=+